ncbi:MAG: DUF4138 domain-containing protein [Saprospiraceae bacterium]
MMKYILLGVTILFSCIGFGQVTDTIDLSLDYNSYLIFNTEDVKFNYGSSSVKVTLSGNKLILEGLEEDFNSTNLLVETDNKLYIFILEYTEQPKKFIYNYTKRGNKDKDTEIGEAVLIDSTTIVKEFAAQAEETQEFIKQNIYHTQAANLERKIMTIGFQEYDMTSLVTNINVVDDYMIVKLDFINESDIDYLMEYLEIVIVNKKNAVKKNAVEEIPVKILSYSKDERNIKANGTLSLTLLIDKVTLSKKKKMVIRIIENNKDRRGDRSIQLNIPYQYINKAKIIE